MHSISAQSTTDTLPAIFMIGEHESLYNEMISNAPDLLMTVCENDMDKAYSKWLKFLVGLENYALEQDVDINGVKIWINVFWDAEGKVKHITFYPKPNSINMEYDLLSALLKEYSKNFTLDLDHDKMFAHYGSASFPSFITSVKKEEK